MRAVIEVMVTVFIAVTLTAGVYWWINTKGDLDIDAGSSWLSNISLPWQPQPQPVSILEQPLPPPLIEEQRAKVSEKNFQQDQSDLDSKQRSEETQLLEKKICLSENYAC